ncbi:MAG: hypothetical protein AAB316_15125, partial [Bacteroidota bacterium]
FFAVKNAGFQNPAARKVSFVLPIIARLYRNGMFVEVIRLRLRNFKSFVNVEPKDTSNMLR